MGRQFGDGEVRNYGNVADLRDFIARQRAPMVDPLPETERIKARIVGIIRDADDKNYDKTAEILMATYEIARIKRRRNILLAIGLTALICSVIFFGLLEFDIVIAR